VCLQFPCCQVLLRLLQFKHRVHDCNKVFANRKMY
jgi:hypothetical protein